MKHTQGEYALDKEEYLTVQHFAQQYPGLKKKYYSILGLKAVVQDGQPRGTTPGNPVEAQAIQLEPYSEKIKMIEESARIAGEDLYKWVLKGVTEKRSYDNLRLMYGLPCGKNEYYKKRQLFFWILNKKINDKLRH